MLRIHTRTFGAFLPSLLQNKKISDPPDHDGPAKGGLILYQTSLQYKSSGNTVGKRRNCS